MHLGRKFSLDTGMAGIILSDVISKRIISPRHPSERRPATSRCTNAEISSPLRALKGQFPQQPLSTISEGQIPMGIRENQSRRCHGFRRRSTTCADFVYAKPTMTKKKPYAIKNIQNFDSPLTVTAMQTCTATSSANSCHGYFCALSSVSYNPQNVGHGGKTLSSSAINICAPWITDNLFVIAFHSSFFLGGGGGWGGGEEQRKKEGME